MNVEMVEAGGEKMGNDKDLPSVIVDAEFYEVEGELEKRWFQSPMPVEMEPAPKHRGGLIISFVAVFLMGVFVGTTALYMNIATHPGASQPVARTTANKAQIAPVVSVAAVTSRDIEPQPFSAVCGAVVEEEDFDTTTPCDFVPATFPSMVLASRDSKALKTVAPQRARSILIAKRSVKSTTNLKDKRVVVAKKSVRLPQKSPKLVTKAKKKVDTPVVAASQQAAPDIDSISSEISDFWKKEMAEEKQANAKQKSPAPEPVLDEFVGPPAPEVLGEIDDEPTKEVKASTTTELDEPMNDKDLEALNELDEMVGRYVNASKEHRAAAEQKVAENDIQLVAGKSPGKPWHPEITCPLAKKLVDDFLAERDGKVKTKTRPDVEFNSEIHTWEGNSQIHKKSLAWRAYAQCNGLDWE